MQHPIANSLTETGVAITMKKIGKKTRPFRMGKSLAV